jgi:THO complex subunit 4
MSNKLEMSLDEITKLGRSNRRGAGRRRPSGTKKANGTVVTAPVGGVKKNTKPAKPVKSVVPTITSGSKESKVIVSGLVSLANWPFETQLRLTFLSPPMLVKPTSRYVDR